jgi:AcrR family transcriptional regulator
VARAASRLAAKAGAKDPLLEDLARELGVNTAELREYLESVGGTTRAGAPLDRERVVSAAITIADERGLQELTLRRVATKLGVTPMALYRYVENKDAMLDAMVDQVFGTVVLPQTPAATWQDEIRHLLRALRDAIAPHPSVASLMITRPIALGEQAARVRESALGALAKAGLRPRDAFELMEVFVNVAAALMLREASLARRANHLVATREERLGRLHAEVASYPADRFPHLSEAIEYWTEPPDPTTDFDRAVDMLISGMEAEAEALSAFGPGNTAS